jgi:HSP20 family protein
LRRRDPFEEHLFGIPSDSDEAEWEPATDVYRTPGGWFLKMDVAGVRPGDVEVRATADGAIVVRGMRRDRYIPDGFEPYRVEILYSSFERKIQLPLGSGSRRIEAEFRDGLLLITILET